MKRNDIPYVMIKSAVEKGIKDIQDNPGRGIRNLVDLGGMFADGRFQKEFFDAAFTELQKEDSMYYQLVERVVTGIDPGILTGFGMNLGYNSWTLGARIIREIENKSGFNIPWCLLLDMEHGQYLEQNIIRSLIMQGKDLGISAYLFYFPPPSCLDDILQIARLEQDCAFMLFVDTSNITEDFAHKLLETANVWGLFDLDSPDADLARIAADTLARNRCLYGGFSRYIDLTGSTEILLNRCKVLDIPFLVMIGQEKQPASPAVLEDFYQLRKNLPGSIFPIDLYSDIALIDRNISSEACLTEVLGDGSVFTTDADHMEVRTGYNIKDTPLRDIFAKTMPKKRDATSM